MAAQKITSEMVAAAILGFEEQKRRIDTQIADLRAMLSGEPAAPASAPGPAKRARRKMSAAARKAMSLAQRKRWATSKGEPETAPAKAAKPKRRLSAEGKANIVAALKKRWAEKKAAEAKAAGSAKKAASKRK